MMIGRYAAAFTAEGDQVQLTLNSPSTA